MYTHIHAYTYFSKINSCKGFYVSDLVIAIGNLQDGTTFSPMALDCGCLWELSWAAPLRGGVTLCLINCAVPRCSVFDWLDFGVALCLINCSVTLYCV